MTPDLTIWAIEPRPFQEIRLSNVDETDLSGQLVRSITYPYGEAISWSLSDPATGGTDAPGEHHVWFQLRDDQGHWTSAGLAVVFVDLDPPIGSVNLAGETAVGSSDVLLDVTAEDADSSVTDVALSNDGTTWTTRDYAPIQSWTLPPLVGSSVEVWARWRDEIGHWSDPVVGTFLVDTEPPSATAPKARLRVGDAVSSGKVPVALTWSGSDTSSGVVAYRAALVDRRRHLERCDHHGRPVSKPVRGTRSQLEVRCPGRRRREQPQQLGRGANDQGSWLSGVLDARHEARVMGEAEGGGGLGRVPALGDRLRRLGTADVHRDAGGMGRSDSADRWQGGRVSRWEAGRHGRSRWLEARRPPRVREPGAVCRIPHAEDPRPRNQRAASRRR